jgi:type IV pilus assembly protein PilM
MSERGVALVQPRNLATLRVTQLPEPALAISPAEPNVTRLDLLQAGFPKTVANGGRRAKAALVIPDYSARITVLDFDELPNDEDQRVALVRFRLRKSVPFPIDDAQVSYSIQSRDPAQKKLEVVVAAIARTVLTEYENVLRSFGFQVGLVVPSCLATVPICSAAAGTLSLLAKLSGNILSILLIQDQQIRVVRCIDLVSEESGVSDLSELISTLLQQTLAFAEDELSQPVQRLILCGFGADSERMGVAFEKEFGLSWTPLRSRFGIAAQENAGLMGLLEQYLV